MKEVSSNGMKKGMSIHARRGLAYVVLILITILCLFWFLLLFINMTRSHSELNQGFSIVPSKYLFSNIKKLVQMGERLPILSGLK
ncbi:MAG: carbohydrate ABC transporter permease, partial [Acetatifactor sp.]|nr:carbohydrate ABC transporter permease [Acetatifactor sp.]